MPRYLVVSPDASNDIATAVTEAYPITSKAWMRTACFVLTNDSPRQIGEKIGIKIYAEGKVVSGSLGDTIVIEVPQNYFGAADRSIWKWLEAALKEAYGATS